MDTKTLRKPSRQNFLDRVKSPFVLSILVVCLLWTIAAAAVFNWGRSGHVTWQPDAIDGQLSVYHSQKIFKEWTHKYPRGHYIINAITYKPFMDYYKSHPVSMKDRFGKTRQRVLTEERLQILSGVSRITAAIMSLMIIIATAMTARALLDDKLAGIIAAILLASVWLFFFYGVSGCVDIPAMFWFAWATFFCC